MRIPPASSASSIALAEIDRTWLSMLQVLKLQAANGFGQEDSGMIIEGMATNGAEPTYCMGDDIPLPVLSSRPHHLGDYFKQRFAQVKFQHAHTVYAPVLVSLWCYQPGSPCVLCCLV